MAEGTNRSRTQFQFHFILLAIIILLRLYLKDILCRSSVLINCRSCFQDCFKYAHATCMYIHTCSNTSLLFWNLFAALKFLNELNIKSCISLNSQYHSAFVSVFSLLTVTTHALHLMSLWSNHHHHSKSLIDPSDMLHQSPPPWNQLPASLRILHPNYSFPSQRPSFEHAGLTCYTLLSPSITFSLFRSELKTYLFRKSYPPPYVCFCLSDWSHGSRPFTGFLYSTVLRFSPILSVLVISTCGRLSCPALWSTFGRTII